MSEKSVYMQVMEKRSGRSRQPRRQLLEAVGPLAKKKLRRTSDHLDK
jgi:hypothetical protein